jgi:hypothetical protein
MREKFELACKIIGLVLFCSSIFVLLSGIAIFVKLLDVTETIPQSSKALLTQSQIAELQNISSSMRIMYSTIVIFFGIMAMLLGIYLMKSNNLFVKLCYPARSKNVPEIPSEDIQVKINAKQPQKGPEVISENKYAPPGYFR